MVLDKKELILPYKYNVYMCTDLLSGSLSITIYETLWEGTNIESLEGSPSYSLAATSYLEIMDNCSFGVFELIPRGRLQFELVGTILWELFAVEQKEVPISKKNAKFFYFIS